jgi:hypothetical protein
VGRLAVMAHYDPRGDVAPHVERQVEALATAVDELVVVSTAPLVDAAATWLGERSRLVRRENVGYDFYSYRAGLASVPDLAAYDEVVLCNDTYVGPLTSYSAIFEAMAGRAVDFWGLSASKRISPHVQSFFVTFRPWVVSSRAFTAFWETMEPVSDRTRVIHRYEVGLSTTLADAGFRWDAYYAETEADMRLGHRRVAWWAAHRGPAPGSRERRAWYAAERKAAWNPAIGLADVALDEARLPYVKLDTLRHDPYGLNAAKLLSLCERRFPDAFAGVREHIESTRDLYPPRPRERLRATPVALRPLRPFVEYGRAA